MSRFLLDTVTNIPIRRDGGFVRVTGREEISQNVRVRLQLFRGEAWLETLLGVPYFDEVLLKGIDPAALEGVFREAIQGADGITSVDSIGFEFDPATRILVVTFTATGTLPELAEDLKFSDTLEIAV